MWIKRPLCLLPETYGQWIIPKSIKDNVLLSAPLTTNCSVVEDRIMMTSWTAGVDTLINWTDGSLKWISFSVAQQDFIRRYEKPPVSQKWPSLNNRYWKNVSRPTSTSFYAFYFLFPYIFRQPSGKIIMSYFFNKFVEEEFNKNLLIFLARGEPSQHIHAVVTADPQLTYLQLWRSYSRKISVNWKFGRHQHP